MPQLDVLAPYRRPCPWIVMHRETSPTGEIILHIGDSELGPLGLIIIKDRGAIGVQIEFVRPPAERDQAVQDAYTAYACWFMAGSYLPGQPLWLGDTPQKKTEGYKKYRALNAVYEKYCLEREQQGGSRN